MYVLILFSSGHPAWMEEQRTVFSIGLEVRTILIPFRRRLPIVSRELSNQLSCINILANKFTILNEIVLRPFNLCFQLQNPFLWVV